MTKNYNKKLGKWGEELAAQFLIKKGYQVINKNFKTKRGEIDLICTKDDDIIFIEVKTRTTKSFGFGEEAVSYHKKQKALRAINKYLIDNDIKLSPRYDVVIVELFSVQPNFIHYEAVEID